MDFENKENEVIDTNVEIFNSNVATECDNKETGSDTSADVCEDANQNVVEPNIMPVDNEASEEVSGCNKKKQRNGFGIKMLSTIALGLIFGLTASVSFCGFQHLYNNSDAKEDAANGVTLEAVDIVEAPKGEVVSTSISTVASNTMPSVVSITNLSVQEVQSFFFGTQQYESQSTGSGIIVGKNDTELLIATNNHVITGNKKLTVMFVDGANVDAIVKGADANIDIAVIAVKIADMKQETLESIKVATLGDSDTLIVGEPTIAIGNALGYGQSVTSGIVSAVNRKMDGFDTGLVQTDAAINPGNSGGALLNIRGEVIGINTAKVAADAVEGMGYAIPISEVKEIIEEMMNRETREKVPEDKRGKIGIVCVDVNEMAAKYYNMPTGAYINEVTEDGPSDKAGVSKGSIITKFDKTSVSSSTSLVDLLAYYAAGETIEVEIAVPTPTGDYETKVVEITLEKAD